MALRLQLPEYLEEKNAGIERREKKQFFSCGISHSYKLPEVGEVVVAFQSRRFFFGDSERFKPWLLLEE